MLRTYKDLKVWQKSFSLCAQIYRVSRAFPAEERFGLTAQLRRAAVSVPSNIAEGYARDTTRDYVRFLWLSSGSLAEIETQLMLAARLEMAPTNELDSLLEQTGEIERMLRALIRSLGGDTGRRPQPTNEKDVPRPNP